MPSHSLCSLFSTLFSLLSFLSLDGKKCAEERQAHGDEDEEKRSCDEFLSRERKIGGDGKSKREKKRREEERGRRRMESFFHPLSLATVEEEQDYGEKRTFLFAHTHVRTREDI